jgi:hypothetical protein
MTVIAISSAPDRASYERVREILDLDDRPVPGLVLHAAGELDDGEVRIVQVFESAEAIQGFAEGRLMPAFGEAGVMIDRERAPRPLEAFHVVTG